jgi:cell division protein FtsB
LTWHKTLDGEDDMRLPVPSLHHIGIALILFASFYFATLFSATAVKNQRLSVQEQQETTRVTKLHDTNVALKADLQYYGSDTYVQYAARDQLGLMMPGDHVLRVGVASPISAGATPAPAAKAESTTAMPPPSRVLWTKWWDIFFGAGR